MTIHWYCCALEVGHGPLHLQEGLGIKPMLPDEGM